MGSMRKLISILSMLLMSIVALSQTDSLAVDSAKTKAPRCYRDTVIQRIRISHEPMPEDTTTLRPIKPLLYMNGYNPQDVLPYMRPEARVIRPAIVDSTKKDSTTTIAKTEEKEPVVEEKKQEDVKPEVEVVPEVQEEPQKEEPVKIVKEYKIQVGAMKSESPAFVSTLQKIVGKNIPIEYEDDKGLKKVMVGDFSSYEKADKIKKLLAQKGFSGCFIVTYENASRVLK